MQVTLGRERLWWMAVGTIVLAGLGLRIAAAQGGLWTDEAWSVVHAAGAGDPLGVFLRINHDNNHHLYSLWLQAIGPAASPFLARAPAILAGTLCILVAALLCGRRSPGAGIVAALLFAVAPMLVVFGAEARGYAPMLLAALLTLLIVADALDGRPVRGASGWLAVLALLGMFSHMTMAAPIGIATLWFYLERRRALGPAAALSQSLRLMGPAAAATVGVAVFVIAAAALSPTGMRLGGYAPFLADRFSVALNDLALWSVGLGAERPWLVPLLLAAAALGIAVARPDWLGSRARLYALLILAIPVGAALVQPGNSSYARYYLTSAVGLLLLTSEWIARGLAGRPVARVGAVTLAVVLVTASLYRDSLLIAADRGRPAAAVASMAALSPSGARIAFTAPRLEAVVAVAATHAGYPAHFAQGCAPADFLLAARSRWSGPLPARVTRCGVPMEAIDSSVTTPLTGDSWVLYRSRRLQSAKPADSGPAPKARGNAALPAERA